MAELVDYARTLAGEIGPRPAATDAEHRAAEWLAQTFGAYGLETEMQEFDAPRTYGWAYAIYHLLTLAAAFGAGFKPFLVWPAFAVSAIVAFFLWTDLDTRWGLTRLMPKGPSQNVIARHVPRARRGERLRRIVIVAHYDSARSSLAFAPNMVGRFATTFALMKWCTILVPVMILAMALPFTAVLDPWIWYATMAVSAYLIIPLVINVHRELFMPFVDGANDNASGVAAMLGVMEGLVPAPDLATLTTTGTFPQIRRSSAVSARDPFDAEFARQGSGVGFAQPEAGGAADQLWADEPPASRASERDLLEFDTIEFAAIGSDRPAAASRSESRAPESDYPLTSQPAEPIYAGEPEPEHESGRRGVAGLLGKLGRKKEKRREEDVSGWLGVDGDFDARAAGRDIGSWDNFGEDDDDGFGWKGGWAGDDPIGDPEFAANEAARIRRRVTESVDRELTEKEIWFVATGAEEVGTYGMQALLHDYGEELKDALIINIDGVGNGRLSWVSAEGMARRYRANQRLVGLARRASRGTETVVKPRVYRGLSTDATPALARGYKAISIMALDANGYPGHWHWKTDTVDNLDPSLIQEAAEFISAMVRDA